MSYVEYDNNRIIPAPTVNIQKEYNTLPDGTKLGSTFSITLTGSAVAWKGSPTGSGTWHVGVGYPPDETVDGDARLGALLRKQESFRELFADDGKLLEIQSLDGSQPLACNPVVKSINFQEGKWYDTLPYQITLEAANMTIDGSGLGEDSFTDQISSASESWAIENNDQYEESDAPTYRMTHTLNAVGKKIYDSNGNPGLAAWQQARNWVLPKLGFDSDIALSSGVNNLPAYYGGFNHVRSENLDEFGGNYSVTETWILSSGNALEDFNVQTNYSLGDGLTAVSVDGTINGLEERDANFNITGTKYDNAATKFTAVESLLHTRAETFSSATLHTDPVSTSVGRNSKTGAITYSYEYNNRPSNFITDTISESVVVNNSWNVDVIASVSVLGRATGPVLQSLNTHEAATRSLSMELVFGPTFMSGDCTLDLWTNSPRVKQPYASEIQGIVYCAHPISGGVTNNVGVAATSAYISQQNDNWDAKQGRYSYNISWTFE